MNASVVQSMFKHLVQSYSLDEARDILIGKYPDQEGEIRLFVRDFTGDVEESVEEESAVAELVEAVKRKQAKPVVAKAAKPAKPAKVAKAAKPATTRTPRGESKMQKAKEMFAKAKDQSRKAMIAMFVKELGLSPVAASTYFYNCKK